MSGHSGSGVAVGGGKVGYGVAVGSSSLALQAASTTRTMVMQAGGTQGRNSDIGVAGSLIHPSVGCHSMLSPLPVLGVTGWCESRIRVS